MTGLPHNRPRHLSLGPLESEILGIVWECETVTVKDVHQKILSDPDRDLTYSSVTTVLKRLTDKGWLMCEKSNKIHVWHARVSRDQANSLRAYDQLNQFLAIGNPDIVAAFADELDHSSLEKLDAIAARLRQVRQAREAQ